MVSVLSEFMAWDKGRGEGSNLKHDHEKENQRRRNEILGADQKKDKPKSTKTSTLDKKLTLDEKRTTSKKTAKTSEISTLPGVLKNAWDVGAEYAKTGTLNQKKVKAAAESKVDLGGASKALVTGAAKSSGASMANAASTLLKALDTGTVSGKSREELVAAPKPKTVEHLERSADRLAESADKDISIARETLGDLVTDVGVGLVQLGGDVAAGMIVPGGALISMSARAFGGKAQQVRQKGGSIDAQVAAGTTAAVTEFLIEKLFSVGKFQTKYFGSGAVDDILEGVVSAVEDLGKTESGKAWLNHLATGGVNFLSEGVEEGLAGMLEPVADRIIGKLDGYEDKPLNWKEIGQEAGHAFLVGGIIGALGGTVGGTDTGKGYETGVQAAQKVSSAEMGKDIPRTENAAQMRGIGRVTTNFDEFAQAYRAKNNPDAADTEVQEQYELFKAFASGQDVVETADGPLTRAEIKERLNGLHDEQEIDQLVDGLLDEQESNKVGNPNEKVAETENVQRPVQMPRVEKPQLIRDKNWRKAHLSSKDTRKLEAVAQVLGVEIRFEETVDNGESNAKYKDGVISLALNAKDPVMTSVIHESIHRIRELDADVYDSLSRFVQSTMSDVAVDSALYSRSQAYQTGDVDVLTEEMVADAFGRMLADTEVLDRFVQDNRNAAEKILDTIRDTLNSIMRVFKNQNRQLEDWQREAFRDLRSDLQHMEQLFTDAMKRADGMTQETKNTATKGGEGKYSIKRTSKMTLAQQLKSFYGGEMASSDAFYFGTTSATLAESGLDPLPLAMTIRDFKKSTKEKHNIPRRVLKQITRDLDTAMFTFASGDRIGVMTTDIDGDGKPLLIGIERNVQMDADRVNVIQSMYGLDDPAAWLANQIKGGKQITVLDEEKANAFLYPYGYMASRKEGIRSLDESVALTGPDVKHSKTVREDLDAYIAKYGALPKGERPVRDIQMPRQTSDHEKLSQTVRTVMEAGATPEEMLPSIEKLAAEGAFSYESYTDKQAIQDARDKIGGTNGKGWTRAYSEWSDAVKKGKVSKELTTMGWTLYNNAANSGDTKLALDILDQMVRHQRSAAQALQATRILKKLSPETQLYQVQRSVNNLQDEINQRYGDKKGPVLKVDEDLAEQLLQAETQEERDEILKDIYRDIGKQMPSRFLDKWNAWRYLAMLGNPRTHVRNIIGNAGFAPVVAAKNLTATAIESAVSRVSGGKLERTKGLVGLGKADRELLKAAWSDYAGVADATMNSGKYDDLANANKYIDEGRVIFKTKPLETARKKNSALLEKEDAWFSQPHYANAMAQYCKVNGITAEQLAKGEGLDKAREYAVKEAQKATYRDANTFSKFVSELGRKADSNKAAKAANVALEGILPFRKTPANILVRGVEYSPIGLVKSLTHDLYQVKKGDMTGAEAIDNISAGLTGSMLLGLGVYLAAQGLVRGSGEGDDKERQFDELQGRQTYSMELGDTSVTLDWLAPECLPFFVGVNLWEQSQGENVTFSDWMDAIKQVGEPMLEMSCLQSLNDAFDSMASAVTYGGSDGLTAFLISAATSYITQGIPTLGGQIERSSQADRMTTYTNKDSWIPTDAQYVLGRASSRLPGDYNQIPYIDAWGRRETEDNAAVRVRDNMANPAYMSKMETSAMEEELKRLYKATGESVFPSRADRSFSVDKEKKNLTGKEYVEYATQKGQISFDLLTELTSSQAYKSMDDADKARAVSEAYSYANAMAKTKVSDYKPDGWIAKAVECDEKYGISVSTYITAYAMTRGIESIKDKNGDSVTNSKGLRIMQQVYRVPGLTKEQVRKLAEELGAGKTVLGYNEKIVERKLERMEAKYIK